MAKRQKGKKFAMRSKHPTAKWKRRNRRAKGTAAPRSSPHPAEAPPPQPASADRLLPCCSRRRSSAAPTARLLRASSAGHRRASSAAPPLVRDRDPPPLSTPSEHRRSAATVDRRRRLRPPQPRPSAAALLRDRDPPPTATSAHRDVRRQRASGDRDRRRRVPPPTATLHRPRRPPTATSAPQRRALRVVVASAATEAPPKPTPPPTSPSGIVLVDPSEAQKVHRLKTVYDEKVVPLITEEFGYATVHQVPKLEKIVVNCGQGAEVRLPRPRASSAASTEPAMAGFGDEGTGDYFSQPDPYSQDEGFDLYSDDAARTPVSTSVSRLAMEGLALNSQPEGWPYLGSYRILLQSDGGSGSNGSRRPVRSPPPRRDTGGPIRRVGLRRPRAGGPSSSLSRGRVGGFPPASASLVGHLGRGRGTSLGTARHGASDENELEDDDDVQDIVEALDGQLDSSDEEVLNLLVEDAEHEKQVMEMIFIFGMYDDTYMHQIKRRTAPESGQEWVMMNLADETECYNMFRMTPPMFYSLHDLLVQSYGLKSTSKCNSIEALGMFLWMVGACQSVRQADNRLQRSLDTVHHNFEKVLKCLVKLAADIIRPLDLEFKTIHRRLQCPRFRPHFNDCIGAIDGTHVEVVVPNDKMVQYLCRKGITTQNVLAVVDFDMRFTFVLAGWPGSVHDMRVFNDATNKYKARFSHPPLGKYYLVDSGYPNRAGYLHLTRGQNTIYHSFVIPQCREV